MKDKYMKKKEKTAILRNTIYETNLKLSEIGSKEEELIALHTGFLRAQFGLTIQRRVASQIHARTLLKSFPSITTHQF